MSLVRALQFTVLACLGRVYRYYADHRYRLHALVYRYAWIARTRTSKDFVKHLIWKNDMNLRDLNKAFDRWLATVTPPVRAASAPTPAVPVTAALSIEQSDICPYCRGTMRRTTAAGHHVYTCDSDRHVTPVENNKIT